jgi:hopanoid-associated phosphorylase
VRVVGKLSDLVVIVALVHKLMPANLSQTLIAVVGLPFEARLAGDVCAQIICGADGQNLAASLTHSITSECHGLISLGVAGGLLPNLAPGTCVVGSEILWGSARLQTDERWSRSLLEVIPHSISGKILGVPRPIAYVDAKHILYKKTGALAVDMESHIVASVAAANGLRFAAIRVIADPANHSLPQVALGAIRQNGTVNIAQMILSLLTHPRDLFSLAQTARDAFTARVALGHICTVFNELRPLS